MDENVGMKSDQLRILGRLRSGGEIVINRATGHIHHSHLRGWIVQALPFIEAKAREMVIATINFNQPIGWDDLIEVDPEVDLLHLARRVNYYPPHRVCFVVGKQPRLASYLHLALQRHNDIPDCYRILSAYGMTDKVDSEEARAFVFGCVPAEPGSVQWRPGIQPVGIEKGGRSIDYIEVPQSALRNYEAELRIVCQLLFKDAEVVYLESYQESYEGWGADGWIGEFYLWQEGEYELIGYEYGPQPIVRAAAATQALFSFHNQVRFGELTIDKPEIRQRLAAADALAVLHHWIYEYEIHR